MSRANYTCTFYTCSMHLEHQHDNRSHFYKCIILKKKKLPKLRCIYYLHSYIRNPRHTKETKLHELKIYDLYCHYIIKKGEVFSKKLVKSAESTNLQHSKAFAKKAKI